jgi:hypothetical protein
MRKSLESSRIYEPNYYLFWSVYRRAHDPAAAPKDAPNEARDCRVRHSKDVPVMWVDHISTKGVLLGVRPVSYIGGAFGYTQVNRILVAMSSDRAQTALGADHVRRKVLVTLLLLRAASSITFIGHSAWRSTAMQQCLSA